MKQFYFFIFKFLFNKNILLLHPNGRFPKLYTYFIYNLACISLIGFSYNSFNFNVVYKCIAISVFVYFLDKKKIGFLLYRLFFKWLVDKGLAIKDNAYQNWVFVNESFNYKQTIELLEGYILFNRYLLKGGSILEKYKDVIEKEICMIKEGILEYRKSKLDGISLPATFFSSIRPLSFLAEHEIPIASAFSFTLLLTHLTAFLWLKGILDFEGITRLALIISIFYTICFFSVLKMIKKTQSLSFEVTYNKFLPVEFVNKFKEKNITFNKVEIRKDFFKYYFIFYTYKFLISTLLQFIYIIIYMFCFWIYEYFINDINIISFLLNYTVKFSALIFFSISLAFILYSSFVADSFIKITLFNTLGGLLLFGVFSFIFTGEVQLFIEKAKALLIFPSILLLLSSYLFWSFRRIFYDKNNDLIWELE